MCRLVGGFAGHTYHIVQNLMSRLNYDFQPISQEMEVIINLVTWSCAAYIRNRNFTNNTNCLFSYLSVFLILTMLTIHGLQSLPPSPKRAERKGRRRPFREAGSGHKQWNTVGCVDTFSIISKFSAQNSKI